MTGFSEADREQLAVDTLGEREWRKLSGTQIAPGAEGGRQSWDDVVLVGRMLNKMRELNPDVPAEYLDQARAAIIQPQSQDAIADAKNFVLKYYNVCCAYRCATQSRTRYAARRSRSVSRPRDSLPRSQNQIVRNRGRPTTTRARRVPRTKRVSARRAPSIR